MLSELPAIHAYESSLIEHHITSSVSITSSLGGSGGGSTKMISAHSNTSIASTESSTIATTSSDNVSTFSTDNSDACMSDTESKTMSDPMSLSHVITPDSTITELGSNVMSRTGLLTQQELRHHSLWASNIEIQDKSFPDFSSTAHADQTTRGGETRTRGGAGVGKGEGEDKISMTESILKSIKERVCGLQTLHLAHNSFSGIKYN